MRKQRIWASNGKFGLRSRGSLGKLKSKNKQATSVRDKEGKMITYPHSQKDWWKEHFTELLYPPLSNVNLADIDGVPTKSGFGYLSCSDGPPTRDETGYSPKKLTIRARDGKTNEQLKFGEAASIS